jgi:lipid A 3-O-deacylase
MRTLRSFTSFTSLTRALVRSTAALALAPVAMLAQTRDSLAAHEPSLATDSAFARDVLPRRDVGRVMQLGFENDLIAVRGAGVPPDYDYSSGIRLSLLHASAPAWVHRLTRRAGRCDVAADRGAGCVAAEIGNTHQIYTPRINSETPVAGERPYAGWLFGSADVVMVSPGHSRAFGIDAGVTGPASMAEEVQNSLHRLLDNTPKLGWRGQLPNAPAIVLRYDEGRRAEGTLRGSAVAIDAHWGARSGNVVSALSGGVETSLSFWRAQPWSPSDPRVSRPRAAYLSVGYTEDLVLHNVLVEGRGSAPGATRRKYVGQFEAGLGYRHRSFTAAYRHIIRGREYEAQLEPHPFGSLTLSVNRF